MTNQQNSPGQHRPERTGAAPFPASGGHSRAGGTPLAGQVMARAWRTAAAAVRADAAFRREYRARIGG